jgi:alpha-methylacyl-CoA racemase
MAENPPLSDLRVLDLSSLLPGPLASLMLSDAGADVVKIERPGRGDEMRSYVPKLGDASANYAVLNRGKRCVVADLKDPSDRAAVLDLAAESDVVIEQFRPGVVARLGLSYADVSQRNPGVVYCSISGYGQHGPYAARAGHDLNYLAQSGLLSVTCDDAGKPQLPHSVLADITAGTYPAVVNILLALRQRDRTGRGGQLDISMTHNLQVLGYGYFASFLGGAGWPRPGGELLTGGSPRYRIYPTADGRHLAVAALEEKFWRRFAELIGLAPEFVDDLGQEAVVVSVVTELLAARTASDWSATFADEDVCTCVVATFDEAVRNRWVDVDSPHRLVGDGFDVGALPSPVVDGLRRPPGRLGYPKLA